MRKVLLFLGFLAAFVLGAHAAVFAQACPLCKAALLNSPEGRKMARAFNDGILLLLAMPYLLTGGLALLITSLYRRRKRGEHE